MNENDDFVEYRAVSIAEPLRQGDVLEYSGEDPTPWNRHLLVITADCDFAYDKHRGRVTCIPLLTKDEYLLEFHIPQLRNQVKSRLIRDLSTTLREIDAPTVSERRLGEWPHEQSNDRIISMLAIPEDRQVVVESILDSIRAIQQGATTVIDAISALIEAQLTLRNAKSEKNLRAELTNRLQNVFKQPPGDALFLSAVADGCHHGYFAYLRHLEQIWETQVATGPERRKSSYRRVARLRENYTHAIVQRFALVFMSIGLPQDYEEMRDLHADILGEELP